MAYTGPKLACLYRAPYGQPRSIQDTRTQLLFSFHKLEWERENEEGGGTEGGEEDH